MIKQLLFSLTMVASATAQRASDGYTFYGNPEPLHLEFSTVVKEYNSSRDLANAIKQYGEISTSSAPRNAFPAEVHAFAVIEKQTCTIHIVKPSKRYMPEHIGHELVHCIYGAWHK